MNVLIAIDSFKGSMSSLDVGNAAKEGILRADKSANISVVPIADGGEGTVDALVSGLGGSIRKVEVSGPLGEKVFAKYGIAGKTAIMEMAEAAGISLVPADKRDPMYTTTFGVGEMIKDAVKNGCDDFVIGIGGSVTNDGGVGMLMALGFEFFDETGKNIGFGAKELGKIASISDENVIDGLKDCSFNIACDVKNPLCGKNGCTYVFAPQKGAKPEDMETMDKYLENFADITVKKYKNAVPDFPGAGAAGGLGFAFMSYLGGKLQSGIDLVLEKIHIEEKIKEASLVITGEGRLDSQTVMGKAPAGIAKMAKKYGKPVIAFSGCVTKDAVICNEHGIDAFFPIIRKPCTLDEAMDKDNAKSNMADTVEQAMRCIKILI